MKYTLILGIEYKKYKNPAVVTVSIGNKFIDTFQLEKNFAKINQPLSNIEQHWLNDNSILIEKVLWKKRNFWENVPSFFKIYQIKDTDIEGNLEIKIDNDNNDFTNGFMKNNSVISLSVVALFPSILSQNKGEKLMKTCFKLNDGNYKFQRRHDIDHDIFPNPTWPTAESFYARRENEDHEKSEIKDGNWTIGGSFTAEFPIRKKHRVKYLGSLRHKEIGFIFTTSGQLLFISSCKSLLNIYDEDQ
jgi:hypothetical protein